LDTRHVKQGLLSLLWVIWGKGLKPHISATKRLLVKLKKKIHILRVLLAKICQNKKRVHFCNLSIRQVWRSLQLHIWATKGVSYKGTALLNPLMQINKHVEGK